MYFTGYLSANCPSCVKINTVHPEHFDKAHLIEQIKLFIATEKASCQYSESIVPGTDLTGYRLAGVNLVLYLVSEYVTRAEVGVDWPIMAQSLPHPH